MMSRSPHGKVSVTVMEKGFYDQNGSVLSVNGLHFFAEQGQLTSIDDAGSSILNEDGSFYILTIKNISMTH